MAIVFGTRADIEQRLTAARLVQIFDDDGDGVVAGTDLATLQLFMDEAADIVAGILLHKGFSEEQLQILKDDKQITRAWVGIFMQLAGERKTEWIDAGIGMYDAMGVRARAELKALSTGETRSLLEAQAGGNANLRGQVGERLLEFSPDPIDPTGRRFGGGF